MSKRTYPFVDQNLQTVAKKKGGDSLFDWLLASERSADDIEAFLRKTTVVLDPQGRDGEIIVNNFHWTVLNKLTELNNGVNQKWFSTLADNLKPVFLKNITLYIPTEYITTALRDSLLQEDEKNTGDVLSLIRSDNIDWVTLGKIDKTSIQNGLLKLMEPWLERLIMDEDLEAADFVRTEMIKYKDVFNRLGKQIYSKNEEKYSTFETSLVYAAASGLLIDDSSLYPVSHVSTLIFRCMVFLTKGFIDSEKLRSVYHKDPSHTRIIDRGILKKSRLRLNILKTNKVDYDVNLEAGSLAYFASTYKEQSFRIITSSNAQTLVEIRRLFQQLSHFRNTSGYILCFITRLEDAAPHALLYAINIKDKEAILFDPHGRSSEKDLNRNLDNDYRDISTTLGLQFTSTHKLCYGDLQKNEHDFARYCTEELRTKRVLGFCYVWQIIIADFTLKNPMFTFQQIQSELNKEALKDRCEQLQMINLYIQKIRQFIND